MALQRLGIELEIFATDQPGPAQTKDRHSVTTAELPKGAEELRLRFFPAQMPYRLSYSPSLDRELAQRVRSFDVVHIHSLYLFPQYAAFRRARQGEVPYVVSPHGALDPYLRRRGRFRKAVMTALWQQRLLENAAALHVTTVAEAQLIADAAPGVRREVVPYGVDWDWYQNKVGESALRQRLTGGRDDVRLVVNLGRLSFKKGLDILIRATALTKATVEGTRLVIAGPDDEGLQERLTRVAREVGVEDDVVFLGPVYGREKLELLASADVWALSSHTENLGIAVVEAMAAGAPTVVSPAVNIAPHIAANDAGLVADLDPHVFASALVDVLSNDSLAKRLSDNGREFARRFDWATIAEQMAALYVTVSACSAGLGR